MRVALFSNSYLPYLSGITISVKMLKDELRSLGHTVYIVGPKYPGHKEIDPQIFRLPSLPATYPGYRFVFPYSFSIFNRLKGEKIDLIHAHQPFGVGLAALLLARRMKIPFVYSFHTLFSRYVHHAPFIPQRLAKRIVATYLTWFCQQADTIIVPSEMVRRLLVLRGVKTPIKVLPTGLKLDLIKQKSELRTQRSELRKKYQLPPDAKILLYSGRLSAEKNVPFLFKAFEVIRSQEENVFFILIGGGPKEKEYRQMAGDKVIFTGQIPHAAVLDHCLAADLFIYASTTETQGLVLTEAKACGIPVVAVFGGGISDVVENGIDGYLVPQNQEKFIEHVLRLLRNDGLRKEMSIKAKEDALARFSSHVVAKKMENVYNSLINKQGGAL
ncbi:MAG: glycosyltransferase [Candidatus Margulisiibacteriota bacterium]